MLVTWGCRKADEKGLKAYCEVKPEGGGLPLYLSEGFVVVDHVAVDLKPWGGKEGDLYWRGMLLRDYRSQKSA